MSQTQTQTQTPLDVLISRVKTHKSGVGVYDASKVVDTDPDFQWTEEMYAVANRIWTPFQRLDMDKQISFIREFVGTALFQEYAPVPFRALLAPEDVAETYGKVRAVIGARLDSITALLQRGHNDPAREALDDLLSKRHDNGKRYAFAETHKTPATSYERTHYIAYAEVHFGALIQYHYDAFVSLESAFASVYEMVKAFEARGLPREQALDALVKSHHHPESRK